MKKYKSLFMHVVIDPRIHKFDLADVVAFEHDKLYEGVGAAAHEPYRLVFIFGDSRPPLETYGYAGVAQHIIQLWQDYRQKGYFPYPHWSTRSVDAKF